MAYTGFGNLACHESTAAMGGIVNKGTGTLSESAAAVKHKGTRVVWERTRSGFAFSTPFSYFLLFRASTYFLFLDSKIEVFYVKRRTLSTMHYTKSKPIHVINSCLRHFRTNKTPWHPKLKIYIPV